MTLAIDTSAIGDASNASSATASISTSGTDRLVLVYVLTTIHSGNTAPANAYTVQKISDTDGLVWSRRWVTGALIDQNMELWWAPASAQLSSDTITVALNGVGGNDIEIVVQTWSGADLTNPFDTNSSLPVIDCVGSGNPSCTFSTTATNTAVLAFFGSDDEPTAGAPSGFTDIQNGTTGNAHVDTAYKVESSAQTSVSASFGQSGGTFNERMMVVDAIIQSGETGTAVGPLGGIDGLAVATGGTGTLSVTFTSINTDTVLFVLAGTQNSSAITVSGVALDPTGANEAFAKRSSKALTGSPFTDVELWWLNPSGAVTGKTIKVTFSGTPSDGAMIAFGIAGIANPASPFDANGALPAVNSSSGAATADVTGVSTTSNTTMLLLGGANQANNFGFGSSVTSPPGLVGWARSTAGSDLMLALFARAVNASQSSITLSTDDSTSNWAALADAVVLGSSGVSGTWASTEATDVFNGKILVPIVLSNPTIDGSTYGSASGSNDVASMTVTLETALANDIIVVAIHSRGTGSPALIVDTITDNTETGLSWIQRAHKIWSPETGDTFQNAEVWYAFSELANSSPGIEITVSLTGDADAMSVRAFGVNGCDLTVPWDPGAGNPSYNTGSGNTIVAPAVDCYNPSSIVFNFFMGQVNSETGNPPTGYTAIGTGFVSSDETETLAMYHGLSSPGSSTAVWPDTSIDQTTWTIIGDAMQPPTINFDGFAVGSTANGPNSTPDFIIGETGETRTASWTLSPLTTQNDNDIVLLFVESVGSSVSTVADVADLSWAKRGSITTPYNQFNGGSAGTFEVWWAHAPVPLSGDVITVTWNSPYASPAVMCAMSIAGLQTPNPWDANGSLPDYASVASANPDLETLGAALSISGASSNASTVLMMLFAGETSGFILKGELLSGENDVDDGPFSSSPLTDAVTVPWFFDPGDASGTEWLGGLPSLYAAYQIRNTAADDQTYALTQQLFGDGGMGGWVDGLVLSKNATVVYTGKWNSTEGVDRFGAAGYEPELVTWASTGHPDVFNCAGFTPTSGVWNSTEAPDLWRSNGGIGEPGDFVPPPETGGGGTVPGPGLGRRILITG